MKEERLYIYFNKAKQPVYTLSVSSGKVSTTKADKEDLAEGLEAVSALSDAFNKGAFSAKRRDDIHWIKIDAHMILVQDIVEFGICEMKKGGIQGIGLKEQIKKIEQYFPQFRQE
jgi:hypothetical protein